MKRREFVSTCAMVGLGLAIGLPGSDDNLQSYVWVPRLSNKNLPLFTSPRGGCTEAGLTMLDKGPFRKGCFGLFE